MDVGYKRKRAVKNDSVIWGGWVLGLKEKQVYMRHELLGEEQVRRGAGRFRLRSLFDISMVILNRQLDTRIWNSEDGPTKECYLQVTHQMKSLAE